LNGFGGGGLPPSQGACALGDYSKFERGVQGEDREEKKKEQETDNNYGNIQSTSNQCLKTAETNA
jgi:hypothetical protein